MQTRSLHLESRIFRPLYKMTDSLVAVSFSATSGALRIHHQHSTRINKTHRCLLFIEYSTVADTCMSLLANSGMCAVINIVYYNLVGCVFVNTR